MNTRSNAITTHVLDAVLGQPAAGISVQLDKWDAPAWTAIASGTTDSDGRCRDLIASADFGAYRLTFGTGAYLARNGRASIYPEVSITFNCDGETHYHLPLLLSDNSYTTYRGS
jgi:5-hydroxyisourate hydrolase